MQTPEDSQQERKVGAKAARLARFKQEHPVCYFCATNATSSEDHVPSRECFRQRVWPEGYVFPACQRCNNSAGRLEQAVALYLVLANHDGIEPDSDQLRRLFWGVRNNSPSLLPKFDVGARAARTHFRRRGMILEPGNTYFDTPILELPKGNQAAMELFARRLTCALYYKEVGSLLPLDHFIAAGWIPFADPAAVDLVKKSSSFFPNVTMTNRRNTNIGNQFYYLWGYHEDKTIFAYTAQFSKSYFFFGASTAPEHYDGSPNWKPHNEDVSALERLVETKF